MGSGTADDIVEERRRHWELGYSMKRDDGFTEGELLHAALAHLCTPGDSLWPWQPERFHPSDDPVENIVTAGALLAAEGDRLKRRRRFGLPVASGMIVLGMSPDDVAGVVDGLREVHKVAEKLKNFAT